MATHRIPVEITNQDSGVSLDLVANQITAGTAPSVGTQLCYVMADGGTDEGVYIKFSIPVNYVGTPLIVVSGILDGTPGADVDLGFGFRKRAVADNEVAAGTFDAEQTVQDTDIDDYADTDRLVMEIALTGADYVAGDEVYGYVYIDASGTTYVGNFLLTDILFKYNDG